MIGYAHFALVLQIADVSLESLALAVVVAGPVGRGEAAVGPVGQGSRLVRTHTTKFYYI